MTTRPAKPTVRYSAIKSARTDGFASVELHHHGGHDLRISRSALSAWLRRHGWASKKKSAHALEQNRPDILKRRQAWFDGQPDLDPAKLVFIDEKGLPTRMARLRGSAPGGALFGERCRAGVPHGHWKTSTFTGGLRLTGMTAALVYDGAMNGNVFFAYVEQILVPSLSEGETRRSKTCLRTRAVAFATRSRRQARSCSTCHLTVPILSDRERTRQAQGAVASKGREDHRRTVGPGRHDPRLVHTSRMRQLLQSRRI